MTRKLLVATDDLTAFGRDLGSGTTPPASGQRRGDVYEHTTLGLLVWTGSVWRQATWSDSGWVALAVAGGPTKANALDLSYRVLNGWCHVHVAVTGNVVAATTIATIPSEVRPARDWYGQLVAFGNAKVVASVAVTTGALSIREAVTTGGILGDLSWAVG